MLCRAQIISSRLSLHIGAIVTSAPSFSNKDFIPYGLDEYILFFFALLPNAKISFPVGIIQTLGFFITEIFSKLREAKVEMSL